MHETLVDQQVRRSIAAYPALHENRFDVLYFILVVPGNGYHWENGIPVSDEPYEPWTAEAERLRYMQFGLPEFMLTDVLRGRIAHQEAVLADLDTRVHDIDPTHALMGREPFGPAGEGSLLAELPQDLNPEWAAAIDEFRLLLAAHSVVC